jgi:hypothetical protein
VYVELAAAMELTAMLLLLVVTEGIREERWVVLTVVPALVLLVCGLFFHGWNPLPTAASARGGGDLLDSLLHCAASIASGVPRSPGWSCNTHASLRSLFAQATCYSAYLLSVAQDIAHPV